MKNKHILSILGCYRENITSVLKSLGIKADVYPYDFWRVRFKKQEDLNLFLLSAPISKHKYDSKGMPCPPRYRNLYMWKN